MGGGLFVIKMHAKLRTILGDILTTLRVSLHNEADEERINKCDNKIVYKISLTGNPSSCLVKFGKNKFRALIDTGAEGSLISRKMSHSLSFPPKVNKNQKPYLQAANGESLSVVGRVNLSFKINGLPLSHNFYVTEGLNRCVI